jgi:hypothetical protein
MIAQSTPRARLVATLIAAPAVFVTIALAGIEAYRLIRPDAALFGGPPPQSLADAITGGFGVEHVYTFIRAGQDPNAPMTVNAPNYTDGRSVTVSPLMLAVAGRDSSSVRMLLNFGARLDLPQNRLASCLAKAMNNDEMIEILAAVPGATMPDCQPRHAGADTPLLAWVE